MPVPSPGPRLAVAAVALAVGVGSVASAVGLVRGLRREIETAAGLGLGDPRLVDDLRRAESPARARRYLARHLLVTALAERPPGDPSAGGAPAQTERLEAAERLARSALAEHPAAWEAAAVAGASRYLRWSEARDPRLLQEYRTWERPLLYALEIAPERGEPARYLAAAYLELWPVLSAEKRDLTEDLLASAFTDRAAFGRLLDAWLRVADGADVLAPIPDRPWAWSALRRRVGGRGDWSAYCHVWRRERQALFRELRARLAEARILVAGGELALARKTLLAVIAEAPVDRAFTGIVEGALRLLPHGPRAEPSQPAARWLAWAMTRELAGGERSLSVESLTRLQALALPARSAGPPEAAPLAAWVELVRGRHGRAGRIAAASGGLWQPEWAPYLLLEARFHLDQGRADDARRSLEQVHPDWRRHPVFLESAERAASRRAEPTERSVSGADSTETATALDWSYSGTTARLVFTTPGAIGGLRVRLAEVPAQGAALEVRWNGESLGCRAVAPEIRRLEVPVAGGPGIHEIEIEALAGGRIYPGSVELPPPPPPGPSG